MHLIWYGIMIGWGVAIPFGPINLEIVRRNLTYGTKFGLAFGMGACAVDATYMMMFSLGVLAILAHPIVVKVVGCVGAVLLLWFGVRALTATPPKSAITMPYSTKLWRHFADSYMLTMSSPFTIIFWTSISSQIALLAKSAHYGLAWMATGVLIGTAIWELALNGILHVTRHKLPASIIKWLNTLGGLILIGMAIFSLYYVFIHH